MAFYNIATYASKFPSGYDTNKADRAWTQIEASLTRIGFVFSEQSPSTRILEAKESRTAVFDLYVPISEVTAVKRGRRGVGVTHTYTEGLEYVAHENPNMAGYVTQIELLRGRSLRKPDYIEVTGKKGIYIDASDTTSLGNKLLINAIVDVMIDVLNAEQSASIKAQGIRSSSTGKTSVSYVDQSSEDAEKYDLVNLASIGVMADALSYFTNPFQASGS